MPDDTREPTPANGNGHSNGNGNGHAATPELQHDLPAIPDDARLSNVDPGMPLAMRLWLDDAMFSRARHMAKILAQAEGATPKHLLGKPATCFAVIEVALTWRMSPSAVARCTYSTPNGQIGYYGSLCQAVIENSGRLEGGVTFEHYGDWSKVQGKFRLAENQRGGKYPTATYTDKDEDGLGVIVRAQIKGETTPRELRMDLRQCFPRNSTLWATDPKTQICYTSVRRFANVAMPGIFMGLPFDQEDMVDVTPPRPTIEQFQTAAEQPDAPEKPKVPPPQPKKTEDYQVTDQFGEVTHYSKAANATSAIECMFLEVKTAEALEGLWESNGLLLAELREHGKGKTADTLADTYAQRLSTLDASARAAKAAASSTASPASPPSAATKQAEAPTGASQSAKPPAAELPLSQAPQPAVPWTWQHPDYSEVPPSPMHGGGKAIFISWLSDMIADMPADQLPAFLGAHDEDIAIYREKANGDFKALAKVAQRRGVTI